MNDPWNVKSVRQPGQYQSCMKIHGVPLLPPVLSKECRKEMEYYKMLAKEVEKRISMLRPYIDTEDDETNEDFDLKDEQNKSQSLKSTKKDIEKIKLKSDPHSRNFVIDLSLRINHTETSDGDESSSDSGESQMSLLPIDLPERDCDSQIVQESEKNVEKPKIKQNLEKELLTELLNDYHYPKIEQQMLLDKNVCLKLRKEKELILEHNYGSVIERNTPIPVHKDSPKEINTEKCKVQQDLDTGICSKLQKDKELILEQNNVSGIERITAIPVNQNLTKEIINFKFDLNKDSISDAFLDLMNLDGPSSASSKSFTGSLFDIHSESVKDNDTAPKLVRQRSYTVLTPSPQLMAHLELQSLNKGVDMNTISMSESQTSPSCKKRRSWDLETAKMKWSSMALELKQNNVAMIKISNGTTNCKEANPNLRNQSQRNASPYYRSQSVAQDKRRASLNNSKMVTKSDPIPNDKATPNAVKKMPANKTVTKNVMSPINKAMIKDHTSPTTESLLVQAITTEADNPALKVKELYEKIQQQQFIQMTSLIEKQKREQQILHQVFEEQNNVLFKQLKMICPKSPIEIRQAWGDKHEEESGPVSLSQLNDIPKALPPSASDSPVSKTLTETNLYINHCNDVLKKSRDITNNIKNPHSVKKVQNVTNSIKSVLTNSSNSIPSNRLRLNSPEGRKTRSRSPSIRITSRKLNYESASDYEPILTDRTNDTLADLNVTFPSDTEESKSLSNYGTNGMESRDMTVIRKSPSIAVRNGADAALKSLEGSIRHSSKTMNAKKAIPPTQRELEAASKIVAHAKGYLCRRLMQTDRVQATVQTIRDALLCALQLHQDREGIRGADVDLHRRLIQQITAACYSLHDTFVASTASERCALIAADRARRRVVAARQSPDTRTYRQTSDVMSRSHSGVFRSKRPSSAAALMTQSNYETFSGSAAQPNPRRRPWR